MLDGEACTERALPVVASVQGAVQTAGWRGMHRARAASGWISAGCCANSGMARHAHGDASRCWHLPALQGRPVPSHLCFHTHIPAAACLCLKCVSLPLRSMQPKADYAALCHAAEKGSLPMVGEHTCSKGHWGQEVRLLWWCPNSHVQYAPGLIAAWPCFSVAQLDHQLLLCFPKSESQLSCPFSKLLQDSTCTSCCLHFRTGTLIVLTVRPACPAGYCAYDYLVDQAKPLELLKALLAADPAFASTQRHYQQARAGAAKYQLLRITS
eukprot:1160517-Pelagomonas_calceolata.AAC.15